MQCKRRHSVTFKYKCIEFRSCQKMQFHVIIRTSISPFATYIADTEIVCYSLTVYKTIVDLLCLGFFSL